MRGRATTTTDSYNSLSFYDGMMARSLGCQGRPCRMSRIWSRTGDAVTCVVVPLTDLCTPGSFTTLWRRRQRRAVNTVLPLMIDPPPSARRLSHAGSRFELRSSSSSSISNNRRPGPIRVTSGRENWDRPVVRGRSAQDAAKLGQKRQRKRLKGGGTIDAKPPLV